MTARRIAGCAVLSVEDQMLDDSHSSISSTATAAPTIEGMTGSISPLLADWVAARAETTGQAAHGTLKMSISAAGDLSLTIYSTATIADGATVARLQSTYVGYGDPLEWRAIHLPVESAGTAIEDSPATRVRPFRPIGAKPELRFMVLDHLSELRDILAHEMGAEVAIDIG